MPDGISATSIYKGTENDENIEADDSRDTPQTKELPCVIVEAQGEHQQIGFNTGNWRGPLVVTVQANAHVTKDDEFLTLCDGVFSKFTIVGLPDILGQASGFSCYMANPRSQGIATRNGSLWENSLTLECAYAPTDL